MSKKDRQKATAAVAAPAPVAEAAPALDSTQVLFNALEASIKVSGMRDQAKMAGEGVSGLVLSVARACGSLDRYNAEITRFNGWLTSDAGIKAQKSHGIKLEPTKDGKGVKLPGGFKSVVSVVRRYLDARESGANLPALDTVTSYTNLRKLTQADDVQQALDKSKLSARKLTEAERTRLLQESDTHRHLANEIRLMGDRVAKLKGDRLTACVAAIHLAAEEVGKLDAERLAEENEARTQAARIKAAKETAAAAGVELPEGETLQVEEMALDKEAI